MHGQTFTRLTLSFLIFNVHFSSAIFLKWLECMQDWVWLLSQEALLLRRSSTQKAKAKAYANSMAHFQGFKKQKSLKLIALSLQEKHESTTLEVIATLQRGSGPGSIVDLIVVGRHSHDVNGDRSAGQFNFHLLLPKSRWFFGAFLETQPTGWFGSREPNSFGADVETRLVQLKDILLRRSDGLT